MSYYADLGAPPRPRPRPARPGRPHHRRRSLPGPGYGGPLWWGTPYPAYSDVVVLTETGDVDAVTSTVMAALRDAGLVPKGREVDVLARVRAAVAGALG